MVTIGGYITYEAIERMIHKNSPCEPLFMLITGFASITIHLIMFKLIKNMEEEQEALLNHRNIKDYEHLKSSEKIIKQKNK